MAAYLAMAALVGLVVVLVLSGCGEDEESSGGGGGGPSPGQEAAVNATCALSGLAASAAVAAVLKGYGAERIAGQSIAGVVVPAACKPLLNSLIATPEELVTPVIELPNGGTESRTMSGPEFLSPPPQGTKTIPPGKTVAQLIDCGGWDSEWLWRLCLDGQLPAKRTPYAEQLLAG